MAPTGGKIQFETVDVMRVRDGKITEHWGVANLFSLMQQLGAQQGTNFALSDAPSCSFSPRSAGPSATLAIAKMPASEPPSHISSNQSFFCSRNERSGW
jgi:hypothetical protein